MADPMQWYTPTSNATVPENPDQIFAGCSNSRFWVLTWNAANYRMVYRQSYDPLGAWTSYTRPTVGYTKRVSGISEGFSQILGLQWAVNYYGDVSQVHDLGAFQVGSLWSGGSFITYNLFLWDGGGEGSPPMHPSGPSPNTQFLSPRRTYSPDNVKKYASGYFRETESGAWQGPTGIVDDLWPQYPMLAYDSGGNPEHHATYWSASATGYNIADVGGSTPRWSIEHFIGNDTVGWVFGAKKFINGVYETTTHLRTSATFLGTKSTPTTSTLPQMHDLTLQNGYFVAVPGMGSGTFHYTSTANRNATWTAVSTPLDLGITKIIYANGLWILSGLSSTGETVCYRATNEDPSPDGPTGTWRMYSANMTSGFEAMSLAYGKAYAQYPVGHSSGSEVNYWVLVGRKNGEIRVYPESTYYPLGPGMWEIGDHELYWPVAQALRMTQRNDGLGGTQAHPRIDGGSTKSSSANGLRIFNNGGGTYR